MMRSDRNLSIGKLVIGICTVVLTFSFLVLVSMGISEIRDVDYVSRYQTEETYLSYLNQKDYLYLLELTDRDSRFDKEYTEAMLECRAVAHYYEAASLYRAYLDVDDLEAAAKQAERMETCFSQMGRFASHAETIRELFEIEG